MQLLVSGTGNNIVGRIHQGSVCGNEWTEIALFLCNTLSLIKTTCCPYQRRGERYDGTNSRTGPLRPKKPEKNIFERYAKKRTKIKNNKGGFSGLLTSALGPHFFCSAWAGFFDLTGPLFHS